MSMLPAHRLKQIIDLVDEGILTLDADGRVDYVNERGAEMLGRPTEELTGRAFQELGLHGPGKDGFQYLETAVRQRGGSERWLSLTAAPLLEGGRRDGTLVTMRDVSERKRAEQSLEVVESEYRSLFQNPSEAVALMSYALDGEGEVIDAVFIEVNALFSKTFDRPREDFIGKTITDVLGEDALQRHLTMLKAIRSVNKPVRFDTYYEPLDVYVRNLLAPVDENLFILSALDMTRATRAMRRSEESAEIARRQSEALAALMDAVPSAIWIAHDPECRVITGNKAAEAIYEADYYENVSAGTSTGIEVNPARRFFRNGVELRPEELPMQVATSTGREVRDCELEVLVPSGRNKTMLGTAIPLFDSEGCVRGSVASFIDITERKLYERDLAFHAHLLASVHDAIVAADGDLRVVYWNATAEMLFGWSVEEAMGVKAGDLLGARVPGRKSKAVLEKMLHDGVYAGEVTCYHKDGSEINAEVRASVMRDEDGAVREVVASIRDISERMRAERELQEYSRQLERSNDELQQFAYVASHDLQEPLRMVTMYMDLLDMRHGAELSGQAREYMDVARQGAKRMRQLIDDLLQYSRVDTKGSDFTDVDMNQVVRSVVDELALTVSETGATIEVGQLPTIAADESQMRQLVTNLLTNAIKFRGDRRPRVEVTASTVGDVCIFSIEDNGLGIEPRYHDKLFKMFSRLHSRDEYPGSGIGLAISKKIVERHGGWIWVESDGRSGCTFNFTMPCTRVMDD